MAGQPVRREREGRPPAPGARGYSWPPFERGHTVSLRHGIWSARRVDPLVEELVTGLLADRPDLEDFPEAVMAWARAEARCILLATWVMDHGLVDDAGEARSLLRYVGQFERLAVECRARLGLDPKSEADLTRSRAEASRSAIDLEAVRARGREVIEARVVDRDAGGIAGPDGDGATEGDVAGEESA